MSVVSSVLLQMSCVEDAFDDATPGRPGPAAVNRWLGERGFQPLAELTNQMLTGKHPQTFVFGGGFNNFPEDAFAEFLMKRKWEAPESVVLVINPEDGATRIWRPEF